MTSRSVSNWFGYSMDASSRMRVTPITFARFIGRLFGTQRSPHSIMAYRPTKPKKSQRDQCQDHPSQSGESRGRSLITRQSPESKVIAPATVMSVIKTMNGR